MSGRGAPRRSLRAPERRARPRGTGRGPEVCANGQTAVARQPPRMVAHDVPNAPSDRDGRRPMALQTTAVLGSPCDAGAEGGDDPGQAGTTGRAAGLPPAVPRPSTAAGATETSQGPAGERLTCRFDAVEHGRHIRY